MMKEKKTAVGNHKMRSACQADTSKYNSVWQVNFKMRQVTHSAFKLMSALEIENNI